MVAFYGSLNMYIFFYSPGRIPVLSKTNFENNLLPLIHQIMKADKHQWIVQV